jgi:hypothetical protein
MNIKKRPKLLKFDQYCKDFTIEKSIQKLKNSNKAERVLFIRVGGTVVVKNRRRFSYSEYNQKMDLLSRYASIVIDINNLAQHTENYEDLIYTFEEAIWEDALPEGKHKIVAVGGRAFAVRPFITKWRLGWYPVSSALEEAGWTNLKLGVFSSFDLALRALVASQPTLHYLDPDAPNYVKEHLSAIKLLFKRKDETRQAIMENLAKIKKA